MPYDPLRKLQTPDFLPPEMQGWQDMPQDQQVNIQPAVGAFKQRFMGNAGQGDAPSPTMDNLPMDMGGADASGGAAIKGKMKSL